jgi:hypothetical protein
METAGRFGKCNVYLPLFSPMEMNFVDPMTSAGLTTVAASI